MNVDIFHLTNSRDSWWDHKGDHYGDAPDYEFETTIEVHYADYNGDLEVAEHVWLLFEAGAPGVRHPDKEAKRMRSFMVGDVVAIGDRFYRCASVGWVKLSDAEGRRVVSSSVDWDSYFSKFRA